MDQGRKKLVKAVGGVLSAALGFAAAMAFLTWVLVWVDLVDASKAGWIGAVLFVLVVGSGALGFRNGVRFEREGWDE